MDCADCADCVDRVDRVDRVDCVDRGRAVLAPCFCMLKCCLRLARPSRATVVSGDQARTRHARSDVRIYRVLRRLQCTSPCCAENDEKKRTTRNFPQISFNAYPPSPMSGFSFGTWSCYPVAVQHAYLPAGRAGVFVENV